MSAMVVGSSNVNPTEQEPTSENYHVCHEVDILGSGEHRTIPCKTTGRYLIIQLQTTGVLHLAEVKVYTSKGHYQIGGQFVSTHLKLRFFLKS